MNLLPTIRNTAAGAGLCGMFSILVLLISNAIAVFMAMKNYSIPEIKSVIIKGFNDEKANIYVDLEFPERPSGRLISAKTEGKVEINVFMSPSGQPLPSDPSISITIPEDVNLNLLPQKASRFIIDNLEMKFSKDFDASIFSSIIAAKMANEPIDEYLPNLHVVAKAKFVFKSLLIPISFAIDAPRTINLKEMMLAKKDQPEQPKKQETDPEKARLELIKEDIKSKFDYKPRSVKILASDNEKLDIEVVAAIPAVLIPEFLYVETPRLNFDIGFYELPLKSKVPEVMKMINFNVDSFALIPAPSTGEMKEEILIPMSLSIKKESVQGIKKVLELFRDKQKGKIGIQVKQGEEYVKELKEGSLMYWLKDFVLNIPVGEMMVKAEEKKKAEEKEGEKKDAAEENKPSASSGTSETQLTKPSNPVDTSLEQKQVVSFKFLAVERLSNGGTFVLRTRILRSFVSKFTGKLPELNLQVSLDEEVEKLLGIRIVSKEVKEADEYIDINFEFSISNLTKLIHLGIRLGKLGSDQLHANRPEIRRISKIEIKTTSDNIISKFASVFDAQVLLNENGLDKIVFKATGAQIYPNLEEEAKKDEKKPEKHPISNEPTEKKKMELSTKFAINNAFSDDRKKLLEIGTSIDLVDKPYGGNFVQLSWGSFSLKVKNKDDVFFIFKIHEGLVKVGITGGVTPITASFATGITIPSEDDNLKQLGNFLRSFTQSADSFFVLNFEIEYDRKETGKAPDFVNLNAEIPCKSLLIAPVKETPADPKEAQDTEEKEKKDTSATESKGENVESTTESKDKKDTTTSRSADESASEKTKTGKKRCIDEPVEKEPASPERTDFIGKVKNSVLSFVFFQASTLFFHATYPNGYYCPSVDANDFNLKIHVEIALPMIEANVCASNNADMNPLSCFFGAGISRPMVFFIDVIDSQICHVESVVLPQEQGTELTGLDSVKKASEIDYKNNEIPIHAAIKNAAALVEFGVKVKDQVPQFVSIGPVDKASSFNNFIGHIASSLFSIRLPSEVKPSEGKRTAPDTLVQNAERPQPEKDQSKPLPSCKQLEPILVPFDYNNPAVFEVKMASPTATELDLVIGFRLPENAFKGIPVINMDENNNEYNWPALQWGRFKYAVGIKDTFKASISVEKGQVDVKKDGIVPLILQNFAIRFNLKLEDGTELGSTGLRQIWGTFKKFFASASEDRERIYNELFVNKKDEILFYNFMMRTPRGSNSQNELSATGEVPLKDILSLGHVVMNNLKPKDEALPETKPAAVAAESTAETPASKGQFDNVKITMKTISSEDGATHLEFPCLIPGICESTSAAKIDQISEKPVELALELKNILKPVTQIVGSKLGPVLQKFKMSNYPSHIQLKYSSVSETWLTLMLNGAGLISIGLNAFEIDRTALMTYEEPFRFIEIVPDAKEMDIDEFEIGLKVKFPRTLVGLGTNFNIFRDETVMMPLLAPVYYVGNNQKELSNAPFYIGFSSDDRDNPERNNLVSALLASLIPEKVAPGINLDDKYLDMLQYQSEYIRNQYDNMYSNIASGVANKLTSLIFSSKKANKDAEAEAKELEVKKNDPQTAERSALPVMDLLYMVICAKTSYFCDTQIDFNYNSVFPFPNDIVKFVLPATTIMRILHNKKAVVQYIADARKEKRLEITSRTGVNILGSGNVCPNGIDIGTTTDTSVSTTETNDIKFQVIFGKDIDLNVNIKLDYSKIKTMFSSIFDILDVFRLTYRSSTGSKTNLQRLVEKVPAGRRRCLYDQAPKITDDPPKYSDLSNSAIFYEKDDYEIFPNKEFNLYLQLRDDESRVICGSPNELKVKFIRNEQEQGFIKLLSLFSYKRPNTDFSELRPTDARFNKDFNLYEIKGLKFAHSGRYKVQLVFKIDQKFHSQFIKDTVIYVRNEY